MIKLKVKLPDIASEFEKNKKEEVSKKMGALLKNLKEATPVDTGKARDSWRQEGQSVVNDVDYIEELNKGSSVQAGPRFIEKTVLATSGVLPNGRVVSSK